MKGRIFLEHQNGDSPILIPTGMVSEGSNTAEKEVELPFLPLSRYSYDNSPFRARLESEEE